MKIKYCGAHPDVFVPEYEDGIPALRHVVNGEPVEVPDEVAKRLLEQDTWVAVKSTTPKAAPSGTTTGA
jgi:hypothetical protein